MNLKPLDGWVCRDNLASFGDAEFSSYSGVSGDFLCRVSVVSHDYQTPFCFTFPGIPLLQNYLCLCFLCVYEWRAHQTAYYPVGLCGDELVSGEQEIMTIFLACLTGDHKMEVVLFGHLAIRSLCLYVLIATLPTCIFFIYPNKSGAPNVCNWSRAFDREAAAQ